MSTTLSSPASTSGTAPARSSRASTSCSPSGDVTALVGPNGSGKSSLMRTIVGELPVEAGSVRLSPADATIGWLPQTPPDPQESLLAYARRRTGVAEADHALHDASSALAVGAPGAEDRYARRWSTGSPSVAPTSRTGCPRSPPAGSGRRIPTGRSGPSRAARRPASRWRRSCSAATTCCSSTSPPTTSTRADWS